MLYIVVALKAEAQAFVERYKLKKSSLENFILYTNKQMKLIVSGIGVQNARVATQTLINHFDISDEDSYLNIGICGASRLYAIGDILEIGTVVHEKEPYVFDSEAKEIHCVYEAMSQEVHEIVDMESFGFYDAIMHNPAIKKFSIIKVVSDHFEPESVSKDRSKSLILKALSTKKL